MKTNRQALTTLVFAVMLALFCGGVAISMAAEDASKADREQQAANLEQAIANASKDDPYVADEVCLSCHGGTYQAIEELTDYLGDSNPHGGTHGVGGLSCGTCHSVGGQVPTDEDNMCLDCHAWPRPEQSLLSYMDL